jgi:hypothetical protein
LDASSHAWPRHRRTLVDSYIEAVAYEETSNCTIEAMIMLYVFEMSTDQDIVQTPLHPDWGAPQARYSVYQVFQRNPQLPNGSTIVVIAHGHSTLIGNKGSGVVDINAQTFCEVVHSNMAPGGAPGAVFISTCEEEIASFAAGVRLLSEQGPWSRTRIYGHSQPMSGPVPPFNPKTLDWVRIY